MSQSISPAASTVQKTGMVATTLWGSDKIAGIAVDPDGAIWLGAYSRLGLGGEEDSGFTGSLVRFNANGSLDRTFSGDGRSLLPVALDIEDGGNAAVQPEWLCGDGPGLIAGKPCSHRDWTVGRSVVGLLGICCRFIGYLWE
ncbi:hypothetical protein [Pseudomonas sp. BF-RE-24]|uniref:hypothetical protein n=1 Tax=Pseudomonas sp. BF-RE-24 TaxID=2832381 RepID=UPI001CBF6B0B|nr:hypothetical protein [Pseudomonas sp. BF-RE-24]